MQTTTRAAHRIELDDETPQAAADDLPVPPNAVPYDVDFLLDVLRRQTAQLADMRGRSAAPEQTDEAHGDALDATVTALQAENERLTAIVDSRVDECKARATFPPRFKDPQVRRLCREAYAAKQRGEPCLFECWPSGKKGTWWVNKPTVDCYLLGIGVAPVDYHRTMLAQSKRR